MNYTKQQKEALVAKYDMWRHIIDLGDGVLTPGEVGPGKLSLLGLPEDLTGLSVLDIGCWDGFFSFEAEKRGAKRVLATDWACWTGKRALSDARVTRKKRGFDIAKEILDSKVEEKTLNVYDVSPATVGGTFDIVLFLGVLYHLPHPMLALEKLHSVTDVCLIVETAVYGEAGGVMKYMHRRTNSWWQPTVDCVIDMGLDIGYNKVCVVGDGQSQRVVFHFVNNERRYDEIFGIFRV